MPNSVTPLLLIEHLYWIGIWSGVVPTTDIIKTCVQKRLDYVLKK
jgi:hypothetical protein